MDEPMETPRGLGAQILNVAAVLTLTALKVPRYQRAFTWGEREVRQLIRDLWQAFERGAAFYFIGQIVLVRNGGKLEVSDGQQRLTTLTMIIAYVRDRLQASAQHYQFFVLDGDKPRLTVREDDVNFFRGFVQESGQMAALAQHAETGVDSKDQMIIAARTIANELTQIGNEDLDKFMNYVLRCCTLNGVIAEERGCAQTVFAALNITGSPLSGADVIKSDLIENSGLSDADADAAARAWEDVEDMFRREDFARLLELMPFLLTGEHIIAPGDLGAFRAAVERAGGARKFLFEQMPRYAEALRAILTCSIDCGAASADVNRRVHLMKQVERWDWAPAAIAFIATYEAGEDCRRAERFFQALDRFVFACELSAIENRSQTKRYEKVVAEVRARSAFESGGKALALSEAEHGRLVAALNRSRKRDRQRRLLLIRVEGALEGGRLLTMRDDIEVEHIMPKSADPWWEARFPDPALRAEFCHLIGNLTLVTHDQNRRADRKSYPEKYDVYFKTVGAPVHALTESLRDVSEFTAQIIDGRHEALVHRLIKDWGMASDKD
jgi:hypothetical protein